MNYLLRAFNAGHSTATFIANAYDRTGFAVMRAMIDNSFMDIDTSRLPHPRLQKIAGIYNNVNNVAQHKVFKGVSDTLAHGNVGPKPDFKRPVLSAGGIILNSMTRMSLSQTAVIALSIGVGLVAAHMGAADQAVTIPDSMASYLGLKPSSAPPSPRLPVMPQFK